MRGKDTVISGRVGTMIIVAELLLLLLVTWVFAGMPGFHREIGPATVTIQFGPLAPPPQSLARSHQI